MHKNNPPLFYFIQMHKYFILKITLYLHNKQTRYAEGIV